MQLVADASIGIGVTIIANDVNALSNSRVLAIGGYTYEKG